MFTDDVDGAVLPSGYPKAITLPRNGSFQQTLFPLWSFP